MRRQRRWHSGGRRKSYESSLLLPYCQLQFHRMTDGNGHSQWFSRQCDTSVKTAQQACSTAAADKASGNLVAGLRRLMSANWRHQVVPPTFQWQRRRRRHWLMSGILQSANGSENDVCRRRTVFVISVTSIEWTRLRPAQLGGFQRKHYATNRSLLYAMTALFAQLKLEYFRASRPFGCHVWTVNRYKLTA